MQVNTKVTILKEENKNKEEFQKKVKLFTVLMDDIAKKIETICEENKEDDQFREYYEGYAKKVPYVEVIESNTKILRLNGYSYDLKEAFRYNPLNFGYLQKIKKVYKQTHRKGLYIVTAMKLVFFRLARRNIREIDIENTGKRTKISVKRNLQSKFSVLDVLNIQEPKEKLFIPLRSFIQVSYKEKDFN